MAQTTIRVQRAVGWFKLFLACCPHMEVVVLSRKGTTIWVKYDTWVALKNLGRKGDTFDDVIRWLLEKAKE